MLYSSKVKIGGGSMQGVFSKKIALAIMFVMLTQSISCNSGDQLSTIDKESALQVFWKANGKKILDYIDLCGNYNQPSLVTRFEITFKNDSDLTKTYEIMDPVILAKKEIYIIGLEKFYFLSSGSRKGMVKPHSVKSETLVIMDPDWSLWVTRIPILVDSKFEHHLSLVRKGVIENPILVNLEFLNALELDENGNFTLQTIIKLNPEPNANNTNIDLKVVPNNPNIKLTKVNKVECNDNILNVSNKTDLFTLEFQAIDDFSKITNLSLSFEQVSLVPVIIYPLTKVDFKLNRLKNLIGNNDKLLKWKIENINDRPEPLDFTFMTIGKINICRKYGMQAPDFFIAYDIDKGLIGKSFRLNKLSNELAILDDLENDDKSMLLITKTGVSKLPKPLDYSYVQLSDGKLVFVREKSYCLTDMSATKIYKKGVFNTDIFDKDDIQFWDYAVVDGKCIVSSLKWIDKKPVNFLLYCFDLSNGLEIWSNRIANLRKDEYKEYFNVMFHFRERFGYHVNNQVISNVKGKITCHIAYVEENYMAYQGRLTVNIENGETSDIEYYEQANVIERYDIRNFLVVEGGIMVIGNGKLEYNGFTFEDRLDGLCAINKTTNERVMLLEHKKQDLVNPKNVVIVSIDDGKTVLVCLYSVVYAFDGQLLNQRLNLTQ